MPILIFLIGIIIGSFLNVCINRIPKGQSIVFPPSYCPHCHTPLGWYNLIPVFCFIILRGKCKYCSRKISLQYPIVEFLNGILYLLLYKKFSFNLDTIFYSILFSILIIIFFIDLYHQIIPNKLNFLILILGVVYKVLEFKFYNRSLEIVNSLLGLIISSAIFLSIIIMSRGGMGGGDMKLIGVLGFILGLKDILSAIILSFILGGILSILLLLFKIKDKKDPIAFGPFICIAFTIVVFLGNRFLF